MLTGGKTTMLIVSGKPLHAFAKGVIIYETVCMDWLLFVRICRMLSPDEAEAPVTEAGAITVQLKVLPAIVCDKAMLVDVPVQIVSGAMVTVTPGVGSTYSAMFCATPGHTAAEGVMVNTTESGAAPELTIVCAGMLPLPEVVYPERFASAVAVHVNVVPVTFDVSTMADSVLSLHIAGIAGAITIGAGFTII